MGNALSGGSLEPATHAARCHPGEGRPTEGRPTVSTSCLRVVNVGDRATMPCVVALLSTLCAGQTALSSHSAAYRCCVGQTVRIGIGDVNINLAYNFRWVDRSAGTFEFTGYMPQFMDLIAQETGLTWEVVPIEYRRLFVDGWKSFLSPQGAPLDVFIPLPSFVALGPLLPSILTGQAATDADLELFNISRSDVQNFKPWDFLLSEPFHVGQYVGIVSRTKNKQGKWRWVSPFEVKLWVALLVAILIIAGSSRALRLMRGSWDSSIEAEVGPLGAGWLALPDAIYDVFAMLLGGEERSWTTWPERILRMSFLYLVLLTTSTYTANLAAFFTSAAWTIHGPGTMSELKSTVACTIFVDEQTNLRPFAASFIYDGVSSLATGADPSNGMAFCANALHLGTADVFLLERSNAAYFMSRTPSVAGPGIDGNGFSCEDFHQVPQIAFGTGSTLFWPMLDPDLVYNINTAIEFIMNQPNLGVVLLRDVFGMGKQCQGPDGTAVSDDDGHRR